MLERKYSGLLKSGLIRADCIHVLYYCIPDFDEKTADDWDVDMSIYTDPDAGDKDARDFIAMRQETRRRAGLEDTDMYTAGIGKFEKHTKVSPTNPN